ncbi:MAG: glycosyltransferase family 2 protein, partial [Phormidesmis sp.]
MTHISIGILAYNEAAIIQSTLDALLTQSVFQDPHITSEIVVVPNGCTDDTAAIAEAYLKGAGDRLNASKVSWKVCNLPQAGLANAWNTFIHELSSPSADYLFVMSSDIRLIEPETSRSLVRILDDRPEAWVSVDQRIKDVAFKENKTPADWLSLWISKISGGHSVEGEPAWISGQLSCT